MGAWVQAGDVPHRGPRAYEPGTNGSRIAGRYRRASARASRPAAGSERALNAQERLVVDEPDGIGLGVELDPLHGADRHLSEAHPRSEVRPRFDSRAVGEDSGVRHGDAIVEASHARGPAAGVPARLELQHAIDRGELPDGE